jgi:hypothetical protein
MNHHELENKIKEHKKAFLLVIEKVNQDITKFNEANPQATMYDLTETDKFCDFLIESGGWIKDKINGTLNTGHSSKKSLVRKLRKVLGYTYP